MNNQLQSQFVLQELNILHCNLDYNHLLNYIERYHQPEERIHRTLHRLVVEHIRQLVDNHQLFILLHKVDTHQLLHLPKCYHFVLFHPQLIKQVDFRLRARAHFEQLA